MIQRLCKILLSLNFYRHPLKVEPDQIKSQIWSTRLYLGLLSSAFVILALYSSVNVDVRIIEIQHPSLDLVLELTNKQYSPRCPCEMLSINYEYLFELTPTYHQICHSNFTTLAWQAYFDRYFLLYYNNSIDVTRTRYGSSQFQLISAFCDLSKRTISDAITQFGKTQLITDELLLADLFFKQINATIEQLKQALPDDIIHLIQLLRNITNVNQYMTIQGSNFGLFYSENQPAALPTIALATNGFQSLLGNGSSTLCFCANNFTCQTESVIFGGSPGNGDLYYVLPQFYTGCNPIDSIFLSTLACLYEGSGFMEILDDRLQVPLSSNVTALDPSIPSRFSVDTSIEDLFTNLFVELWSTTLFYPSYFKQCQPTICSYQILQRKSPLEIISTITGLIGGLSTIFRFLSPYIVVAFTYIMVRRRRRRELTDTNTHQGKFTTGSRIPDPLFRCN